MRQIGGLMLAAALLAGAAQAQAAPDAAAVLRAAKAATGGAALDRPTALHETGVHGAVAYETWLNFTRYGMRNESRRGDAVMVQGFNGKVYWRIGKDGKAAVIDDPAAVREALTTAYVSAQGWFFPDRFKAASRWLRADALAGRPVDVIEVAPEGGRAFELWFDRSTHLLARIADPNGNPPVDVDVSDYRDVAGTRAAFRGTIRSPDGTVLEEGKVGTVELTTLPDSTFDPPQP